MLMCQTVPLDPDVRQTLLDDMSGNMLETCGCGRLNDAPWLTIHAVPDLEKWQEIKIESPWPCKGMVWGLGR
jgi:hypothetical protein